MWSASKDLSSKLIDVTKDPPWSMHSRPDKKHEDKQTVGRGAKLKDIETIKDEERRNNISRNKNYKEKQTFTELETLEAKNKKLQEEEKHLREKVQRSKGMYILR